MTELKPCPFCGSGAVLHRIMDYAPNLFEARCSNFNCFVATRNFGNQQDAIAAWNKRVTEDKEVQRTAGIEAVIEAHDSLDKRRGRE